MSTLGVILLVMLLLFMVGSFPVAPWYPEPHRYGYWPSGGFGLVLIILLVFILMGRV